MSRKFPIHPANPERICWGCDRYCAADAMACSAERTPHLVELFGDDWAAWAPGQVPVAANVDERPGADGGEPVEVARDPVPTP